MNDKRDYKMPYEYIDDCETTKRLRLRSEYQVSHAKRVWSRRIIDPLQFYKRFLYQSPTDGLTYLVPPHSSHWDLIDSAPWRRFSVQLYNYEDIFSGDAVIAAPGPSMDRFNFRKIRAKIFAVNSAGFRLKKSLWVIFEATYAKWIWLNHSESISHRRFISTARGVCHWDRCCEKTKVFISRFEEEQQMPCRAPGTTVMGALFSVWWLGFSRVFIVGLDLSRPRGKPYIQGVPYTEEGSTNPFDDQVKSLSQVVLPGLKIYNGSPYTRDTIGFEFMDYKEMERVLR